MAKVTLIANSGLQLVSLRMRLSLNAKSDRLFHEWFDDDLVQNNLEFAVELKDGGKVFRTKDLDDCGFVTPEGSLKVSEEKVLNNPNLEVLSEGERDEGSDVYRLKLGDTRHSKLESYYRKWIPLPFLERDAMGCFHKEASPGNWVRAQLIPRGERRPDGSQELDVLLVVDTHAEYDFGRGGGECPVFLSDAETEKSYAICNDYATLSAFCSQDNQWVRGYLMRIVHGVSDLDDIPDIEGQHKYAYLATWVSLVEALRKSEALPTIRLVRDRGAACCKVKMSIDIGNSSTSAVLFEEGAFDHADLLHVQNLSEPLNADGSLNVQAESFDMRLAFAKATFGEQALVGSRQFVWPSIVRLGREAERLSHLSANMADAGEVLKTYSSPKRYLWDGAASKVEWRCVVEDGDGSSEPLLDEVSRYVNDDGTVNEDGSGVGLHYSRRSLMTFAFMEILLHANMQVNSPKYREDKGRISMPRRIDRVMLTCPTAMSQKEQAALHGCLQDAIVLLNKFYGEGRYDISIEPELDDKGVPHDGQWIFDEATCSQFVYLYGQLAETYNYNAADFFGTYASSGSRGRELTVGSVDIGAGTTDVMVCRYSLDSGVACRLRPEPLFWDSYGTAGDDVVKKLIESVLLEGENASISRIMREKGFEEEDIRRLLYEFCGDDGSDKTFEERLLRRAFSTEVCMVVMGRFLTLLSAGNVSWCEMSYSEVFSGNEPSEAVKRGFRERFGFGLDEVKWRFEADVLSEIIRQAVEPLSEVISAALYAAGCDIVLLSGRPTTLQAVKDCFMRHYPVSPSRLVVMGKHRLGRWYPFADTSGYVSNSQSIVAVGAMVGWLASKAGGIGQFSLDLSLLGEKLKPTNDYFVQRTSAGLSGELGDSFIGPHKDVGELVANSLPVRIGCRQFDVKSYPVRQFYVIDFDRKSIERRIAERNKGEAFTDVELAVRVDAYCERLKERMPLVFEMEREDYEGHKEDVRIAGVRSSEGDDMTKGDFALTVRSLDAPDSYWLDSGVFGINIKAKY